MRTLKVLWDFPDKTTLRFPESARAKDMEVLLSQVPGTKPIINVNDDCY